jgi:hypothetical protein
MKKLTAVVLALLAALLIFGCASNNAASAAAAAAPPKDLPDFVLNPPQDEDMIYGTGAAKFSTAQASTQFADNRARVAIAQSIGTLVRNRMVDLQQGSEGDPAMQNFSSSISESLAKANLSGTQIVKREVTPDGTYWTLMSIPASEAKRAAIAALGQNPNKKLADQAIAEMDAAFAKVEQAEMTVGKE